MCSSQYIHFLQYTLSTACLDLIDSFLFIFSDEEISLDGFPKMNEETLKTVVPKASPHSKVLAMQVY